MSLTVPPRSPRPAAATVRPAPARAAVADTYAAYDRAARLTALTAQHAAMVTARPAPVRYVADRIRRALRTR